MEGPMTIILQPEQERLLREAVTSGMAKTADEALEQAFEMLRQRLPEYSGKGESSAAAVRRLSSFGRRHGLSLGGATIKDLLRESRP
jgi:hypothetical protein